LGAAIANRLYVADHPTYTNKNYHSLNNRQLKLVHAPFKHDVMLKVGRGQHKYRSMNRATLLHLA